LVLNYGHLKVKMKFKVNMIILKKAKERGFCPCEVNKLPDDSNVCPCENFLNTHICKCGVYKKS